MTFVWGQPDGMGQTVDASIAESVFGMLEVPLGERDEVRCVNFHPFFQRIPPNPGARKKRPWEESSSLWEGGWGGKIWREVLPKGRWKLIHYFISARFHGLTRPYLSGKWWFTMREASIKKRVNTRYTIWSLKNNQLHNFWVPYEVSMWVFQNPTGVP